MAVVTVRSQLITNINASPPVQNPAFLEGGIQRSTTGIVTVTSGDSIASQFKIARVYSWHRIRSIMMFNSAITSGAINLGLYRVDADGGAVVLANAYASALSIASASTAGGQLAASVRSLANQGQQIWQDAGYSTDPHYALDLVATLTAAAAATGQLIFDVGTVID